MAYLYFLSPPNSVNITDCKTYSICVTFVMSFTASEKFSTMFGPEKLIRNLLVGIVTFPSSLRIRVH